MVWRYDRSPAGDGKAAIVLEVLRFRRLMRAVSSEAAEKSAASIFSMAVAAMWASCAGGHGAGGCWFRGANQGLDALDDLSGHSNTA